MKTLKLTIFNLGLWLLSTVAFAQDDELSMTFTKEFSVANPQERLVISNKFGDVYVESWDKNQVVIEVTKRAWGRNAEKLYERISFDASQSNGEIRIATIIKHNMNTSSKSGFEINYKVKMPKANPLELENSFGYTYLADLDGDVTLEISHGELKAGTLRGKNVEIEVSFASSVDITEVVDAELETSFSSNVRVGKANQLTYDGKNGNFEIEEVNSLNADVAYLNLEIGLVNHVLNVENRFGSGEVEELGANFTSVHVESSHGSFTIELADEMAPFSFEVNTSFGAFKRPSDFIEIFKEKSDHTSASYQGRYKGGQTRKLTADMSFGDFRLR